MNSAKRIEIIGIGDDGWDGLTQSARATVNQAEVLVGSDRVLSTIPPSNTEQLPTGSDLDDLVRQLEERRDRNVVVLATGDPLFYGIARFLCDRLGKSRIEVTPHVSSMQLAFARVKESWDEAYLANLASVPLDSLIGRARGVAKMGLFSCESIGPKDVAATLLKHKLDYFTAYVCENLGSPDERVTQGELTEIQDQVFSPLNVMILVRKPGIPDRPVSAIGTRRFGNRDDSFAQSQPKRGLLTPMEVRVIALALMEIGIQDTIWDVGAGSGSVSIEAARLASEGTAYAIEMDAEDHHLIQENAVRCGAHNVVPIFGKAPEAWTDLPAPDAIFVGGTGRTVKSIVDAACEQLKPGGRIVVNVNSIDNLAEVQAVVAGRLGEAEVRMINIAETNDQLEVMRFESRNPTFLISGFR